MTIKEYKELEARAAEAYKKAKEATNLYEVVAAATDYKILSDKLLSSEAIEAKTKIIFGDSLEAIEAKLTKELKAIF